MNLITKGRGIPKELHAGPVGYNDRHDPLRENAKKMMKGDMGQVSKPYSPESASSPGNTKLTHGYKAGGHVKTGHRIATNMHLPREIDGHMPKKTPQNRMKKAGGVMQGDCGPRPSKREHEVAVQGQKGPRLKKGGDCYAHGGHVMPHKGIGGDIKRGFTKFGKGVKKAAKVAAPYAKAAYNASKPILREVAKKGIDYGSKALGAAATGAATAVGGPGAGMAAGYLASKGSKALGEYATKKAGLKHGGMAREHHKHHMEHKNIGGTLKSAAKSGAKMVAKKGIEHAAKKVSEMSRGGRALEHHVKKKLMGEI